VRYHDPTRLFVELWRDNDVISSRSCAGADDVTREADHLFTEYCQPVEPA
jgi:hypothetical protein